MNSCELAALVTAVSCGIANCVSKEELPLIAAVLGDIASNLTLITVKEEFERKKKARALPNAPEDLEELPALPLLIMPPSTYAVAIECEFHMLPIK